MKLKLILFIIYYFHCTIIIGCESNMWPSVNNDINDNKPLNLGDRVGTYKGSYIDSSDLIIATLIMESNKITLKYSPTDQKKINDNILASNTNTSIILETNKNYTYKIEFNPESTNEVIYKEIINRNNKIIVDCTLKRI